jgi:crotonobetainyl-CoA:carnitine CoA-transferase CaiB-like acyl-CoA transferase
MLLIDAFMARPMADIAADLQRHEIAVGPCLKPGEILRHEQAAANQLALEIDDPELGPLEEAALPE